MEKVMSVEEKIRRAEEIYARRHEGKQTRTATVSINKKENKKDLKLLKKIIMQILISLSIYLVIYVIQNNNYIFSEDFLKKTNEILSYDMNFEQIYQNIKKGIQENIEKLKINNNNNQEGAIGGAKENTIQENVIEQTVENEIQNQEANIIESQVQEGNIENTVETNEQIAQTEQLKELTEEEKDIEKIKATTTFIKPVVGVISSKYGQREPTTATVPKNHTGTDIAANLGAKIVSATDGEVVLASEEGDYGKHLKIQIGEVSIIYAHCNSLYVKQGDKVTQGQEIAEVGSTGNSTGPHLHFEIRLSEKTIDPQKILEL